jgi:hypothetical protein
MRRGQILEPLVAELYKRATGNQTVPSAWMPSTEHPFMAATPDLGDVTDECLVQIKTTSTWARQSWGPPEAPTIPNDYFLQCQHEMAVTGARENRLAVFFADQSTFRGLVWMLKAGMHLDRVIEYVDDLIKDADSPCEFLIIPVFRDEEIITTLIEGERDFWETYVLPHVDPPDESIPQTSKDIIEADAEQCVLLGKLREAKRSQNHAKDEYDELVEQTKTEIGGMSGIKAEGICSISYKAPAPTKSIDYEGAVAEAKRKKLINPIALAASITHHTVSAIQWDMVWADLSLLGDQKIRGEIAEKFTTETQGKRVFRPRFSKD